MEGAVGSCLGLKLMSPCVSQDPDPTQAPCRPPLIPEMLVMWKVYTATAYVLTAQKPRDQFLASLGMTFVPLHFPVLVACRNHILFGGTRILQHTGDKAARLKTPDGGCLVIVLRTGRLVLRAPACQCAAVLCSVMY